MRWLACLFQILFFALKYQTTTSSFSPPSYHLCSHEQCSALLQFKSSFTIESSASYGVCDYYGYPSHPKTMSWNETNPECCSWDGVTCDMLTGQVIELDLSCSQLYGSIPPNSSLFSLRHLQSLNLSGNNFMTQTQSPIFPLGFGQFVNLRYLNLSSSFSGSIPSDIAHLSTLVSLDLSSFYRSTSLEPHTFDVLLQNLTHLHTLRLLRANISSVVPNISFMNLSSLRYLDLGETGLHGKLPDNIFHLRNLEQLYLDNNPDLGGYLPNVNWSSSSSLVRLSLWRTSFSGELPNSISYLKSLTHLAISNCNFSGSIPESLGKLRQIRYLLLSNNSFQGPIPNVFGNLSQLIYLDLSYNNFSGQFPSRVANLTQLVFLNLAENALTGPIPSNLSGLSNLRYLLLNNNYHDGIIPSWVFNLPSLMYLCLHSNQLTGQIHEFRNNSAKYINLSTNELHGEIPLAFCNMSSLEKLQLSHNRLSGEIPECLGNFSTALEGLGLGMNNLHGHIPNTFAKGTKLNYINFHGNQLEGLVPQSLENCRQLKLLDFGSNNINDTFPSWLETLSELQVLVLSSNKFHGTLTSFNTEHPFSMLRIIDLSHNEFSGVLPVKYFKNFKAMRNSNEKVLEGLYMGDVYSVFSMTLVLKGLEMEEIIQSNDRVIDLSCNKFRGHIPDVLGSLKLLRLLNLSHNGLTGKIPSSLGNRSKLESLDLSSNQLSGEIPSQLTSLTFLEVLNLSHNHLKGRTPKGKQFDTFESNSYEGNMGLCRLPLSKECGDNETPQPLPMVDQGEDDASFFDGFTWKAVLTGYGCGMVLGLAMGYLIFLTGKPIWFVKIVEGKQHQKVRRLRRSGNRNIVRRR